MTAKKKKASTKKSQPWIAWIDKPTHIGLDYYGYWDFSDAVRRFPSESAAKAWAQKQLPAGGAAYVAPLKATKVATCSPLVWKAI